MGPKMKCPLLDQQLNIYVTNNDYLISAAFTPGLGFVIMASEASPSLVRTYIRRHNYVVICM